MGLSTYYKTKGVDIMATKKRKNGEGSWGTKTINGQTYKRYRSPEGKDFYGKTEKEVKEKFNKWKEQNQGINLADQKLTLNEVAEEWLKSKEKHIKASTYDGYEYFVKDILGKDLGYDLGNMQIKNITEENISKYIDTWCEFLPKSSMKKDKALLNQIFNFAKRKKLIRENYMSNIQLSIDDKIVKESREPIFLSTEDILKLEKEEQKTFSNGVRIHGNNAKMVIFLLHTGLRFGELTALQWKNVDLKNKNIFIIKNMPVVKNRNKNINTAYVLDNTSPKRKSSNRHVPLSNKAIEILNYFKDNYPSNDEDYVFVSETGNFAHRRNVKRTLDAMLKASNCKVQQASPHDLRHTFGSELIKNGIDVKVVSELLGHKDIQTTYNIYIHIIKEQKMNAIDVFNNKRKKL